MITVYSDAHVLHAPAHELSSGRLTAPFEIPARAERVLEQVRAAGLGPVVPPEAFGLEPVLRVHTPEFVDLLESAWASWRASGEPGDASPWVMPTRGGSSRAPESIHGRLGLHAFSTDSFITEGTWEAARTSVAVALTGQALVARGEPGAFALCRPPGHHAAADLFGGYCFLNNAAIAAQAFLDGGARRVAILDIDFHHGNGTQSIFYDRADVLYLSIHGDPRKAFPYFWGHTDEIGEGSGEGFNVNYPLPPGTAYDRWGEALKDACRRIERFAPDALVVSLGVDAYREDPISFFKLESEDFHRCGARIGRLRLPTLFAMEGGYAIEAIGVNTVNVIAGFERS